MLVTVAPALAGHKVPNGIHFGFVSLGEASNEGLCIVQMYEASLQTSTGNFAERSLDHRARKYTGIPTIRHH